MSINAMASASLLAMGLATLGAGACAGDEKNNRQISGLEKGTDDDVTVQPDDRFELLGNGSTVTCYADFFKNGEAQLFGFSTATTCTIELSDKSKTFCTVPARRTSCTIRLTKTTNAIIPVTVVISAPSASSYKYAPGYPKVNYSCPENGSCTSSKATKATVLNRFVFGSGNGTYAVSILPDPVDGNNVVGNGITVNLSQNVTIRWAVSPTTGVNCNVTSSKVVNGQSVAGQWTGS